MPVYSIIINLKLILLILYIIQLKTYNKKKLQDLFLNQMWRKILVNKTL